jgi:hypothetical protein
LDVSTPFRSSQRHRSAKSLETRVSVEVATGEPAVAVARRVTPRRHDFLGAVTRSFLEMTTRTAIARFVATRGDPTQAPKRDIPLTQESDMFREART